MALGFQVGLAPENSTCYVFIHPPAGLISHFASCKRKECRSVPIHFLINFFYPFLRCNIQDSLLLPIPTWVNPKRSPYRNSKADDQGEGGSRQGMRAMAGFTRSPPGPGRSNRFYRERTTVEPPRANIRNGFRRPYWSARLCPDPASVPRNMNHPGNSACPGALSPIPRAEARPEPES